MRKRRIVTIPQEHDKKFKLVLWEYVYVCRFCGDLKILIIGHPPDDLKGEKLFFLWAFTLCTEDEITNPTRAVWNSSYHDEVGICGWVSDEYRESFARYIRCRDKFRWGK
jgi:hypothetical protein